MEILKTFNVIDNEYSHLMEYMFSLLSEVFKDHLFLQTAPQSHLILQILQNENYLNSLFCRSIDEKKEFSSDISIYSLSFLKFLLSKHSILSVNEDDKDDNENENENENEAGEETENEEGSVSESDYSSSSSSESHSGSSSRKKNKNLVLQYPMPLLIPTLIKIFENYYPKFESMLTDSLGNAQKVFGIKRMKIVEFFNSIIATGQLEANSKIFSDNFFNLLYQIMLKYPTNTILHSFVLNIIENTCSLYPSHAISMVILNSSLPSSMVLEIVKENANFPLLAHFELITWSLFNYFMANNIDYSKIPSSAQAKQIIEKHKAASKPDEVKRRHRTVATDRFEDRI